MCTINGMTYRAPPSTFITTQTCETLQLYYNINCYMTYFIAAGYMIFCSLKNSKLLESQTCLVRGTLFRYVKHSGTSLM